MYTLDLLDGAADADGDTVCYECPIAAVDRMGRLIRCRRGRRYAVCYECLALTRRWTAPMNAVSDGTTSIANTATVTLDGTNADD